GGRARPEVRCVAAWWVIAGVQDVAALDVHAGKHRGDPVCLQSRSAPPPLWPQDAVPVLVRGRGPGPAIIGSAPVHLRPESFGQRADWARGGASPALAL